MLFHNIFVSYHSYMLKTLKVEELIIILFPLILISRSFVLNFFLIIISVIFLYKIIKYKNFEVIKETWVLCFLFFWFYLIFISYSADEKFASFRSSFSQIRFFLFLLFIYQFLNLKKNYNYFIFFWSLILVFFCLDMYLQYFTGKDIFNIQIEISKSRVSGVFGKELIAGSYIAKLSAPLIFYFLYCLNSASLKKKFFIYFFFILIFSSTLIANERLSLIIITSEFLIGSIIFTNKKNKLLILLFVFLISIFLISSNNLIKTRMYSGYKTVLNFNSSSYARIYSSAFIVWKKNILTGVGLKNYSIACKKLTDPDPSSDYSYCSPTHPHNLYLELLSETGLLGLIFFLTFNFYFFIFLKNKYNIYRNQMTNELKAIFFGSISFALITLFPLATSGSFFTSWNACFYWLHLGIAASLVKK